MRDREDECFYDLVYEAWRSCRNSDLVSWDRYDHALSRGLYPDEVTLRDVMPMPPMEDPEDDR